MPGLYDYFMRNKLYSDFKFYRVMKIKAFIAVRLFKNYPALSAEHRKYAYFLLD